MKLRKISEIDFRRNKCRSSHDDLPVVRPPGSKNGYRVMQIAPSRPAGVKHEEYLSGSRNIPPGFPEVIAVKGDSL